MKLQDFSLTYVRTYLLHPRNLIIFPLWHIALSLSLCVYFHCCSNRNPSLASNHHPLSSNNPLPFLFAFRTSPQLNNQPSSLYYESMPSFARDIIPFNSCITSSSSYSIRQQVFFRHFKPPSLILVWAQFQFRLPITNEHLI